MDKGAVDTGAVDTATGGEGGLGCVVTGVGATGVGAMLAAPSPDFETIESLSTSSVPVESTKRKQNSPWVAPAGTVIRCSTSCQLLVSLRFLMS